MKVCDPTRVLPIKGSVRWPGAGRIVALYLGFAVFWIFLSDRAVLLLAQNRAEASRWQSAKGLIFVTVTAVLLYMLLRRAFNERDRALEQASYAGERFEMVARACNDAIYDWNVVTNYIWWNEGFHHLFGYTNAEFEPTLSFWASCLHPEDRARIMNSRNEAVAAGKSWSAEYRFRRKDGTYAHVYDQGVLVLDDASQPIRMLGGMVDTSERRVAAQELELSRRQLRALSARLEQLREEERTHIAREIHDELGQMLTAIKMDLNWAQKRLADSPGNSLQTVRDKIADADELADKMIDSVQRISEELRPDVLDHLGLATAIQYEAQRFEKRTGIHTKVRLPGALPDLTGAGATAIFRVFQELLTNVARHARATEVTVELAEEDHRIQLKVHDNGQGITQEALANPRSLGLLGMRERASLLGGSIVFERTNPAGTVATVQIPTAADDAGFWEMI